MKRGRAPTAAEEYVEMNLRMIVEEAAHSGKSEGEIEALVRQVEAEDWEALRNWYLPHAA